MNIRIILQYSKNYFRMFEKNCYGYFYRFPKKIQSFIKKKLQLVGNIFEPISNIFQIYENYFNKL